MPSRTRRLDALSRPPRSPPTSPTWRRSAAGSPPGASGRPTRARYVAATFAPLAETSAAAGRPDGLADAHATGRINEQFYASLRQGGVFEIVERSLDRIADGYGNNDLGAYRRRQVAVWVPDNMRLPADLAPTAATLDTVRRVFAVAGYGPSPGRARHQTGSFAAMEETRVRSEKSKIFIRRDCDFVPGALFQRAGEPGRRGRRLSAAWLSGPARLCGSGCAAARSGR